MKPKIDWDIVELLMINGCADHDFCHSQFDAIRQEIERQLEEQNER